MYVDDDYTSSTDGWMIDHWDNMQDAVTYLDITGTIYVYSGTYYENICIENKSITFIGENRDTTVIDAQRNAISISDPLLQWVDYVSYAMYFKNSDDSYVSGFKIINATSIDFYDAGLISIYSNLTITDNIFDNNYQSIYSDSDKLQKLIVENNQITDYEMAGVYAVRIGEGSSINNNSFLGDRGACGILTAYATEFVIQNNTIGNHDFFAGLYLFSSNNTNIVGNDLFNNYYGSYFTNIENSAYIDISGGTVSDSEYGFYFSNFEYNPVNISNIDVFDNEYGMYFTNSNNNNLNISDSAFFDNTYGFYSTQFEDNSVDFSNTNIYNNDYGMYFTKSDSNHLNFSDSAFFDNTYAFYTSQFESNNVNISNSSISDNDNGIFLQTQKTMILLRRITGGVVSQVHIMLIKIQVVKVIV